jgi:hypothetical protein
MATYRNLAFVFALAAMALFLTLAPAAAQMASVTVGPGCQLIAGRGDPLAGINAPVYTWQPGDTTYEIGSSSTPLKAGLGYWICPPNAVTVDLSAGSSLPTSVTVAPKQWVLIGDPSGVQAAEVTGAGDVFTYDPSAGYQQSSTLLPGQGAWAASLLGGTITVTPQGGAVSSGGANATSPAPPGSALLAAPTGAPPPSGAVLKADNASDPAARILPQPAMPPDGWTVGYVGDEYQIATTAPATGPAQSVPVAGSYNDVTVSVDARLTARSDASTLVRVGCRRGVSGDSSTYYELFVAPNVGQWKLVRSDPGGFVSLAGAQTVSTALISGAKLHLQLTCAGSTITASIGGQQVASVQDGTYKTGRVFLGAALPINSIIDTATGTVVDTNISVGSIDVRFSNLVLTQP